HEPGKLTWRCLNRLSLSSAWLAPQNRGSLNSAHIHGTDVPVEEPSTASTPEEEDAKRTHREREKLVQERLRIENRIEALLFTQGIRKRPSLRSWEQDLAVLRNGDGREIPRHLRAELDRLRRRLVMTLELIREVEAERD